MSELAAVTGSSRGIGKAIAFSLANAGYDLLLISRKSTALDDTAQEIREKTGRRVEVAYADLLDEGAVVEAVRNKDVAVLVNCGIYQGPGEWVRVDKLAMDELRRLFQGNVLTQVALIKAVLPRMIEKQRGMVFQLVSSSSRVRPTKSVDRGGFQGFGYTSTKAAIAKLIPLLALEYAEYPRLRFFNVDPGLVITDKMRAEKTAARFEKWGASQPEATGAIVAYLASYTDPDLVHKLSGSDFVEAPSLYSDLKKASKL